MLEKEIEKKAKIYAEKKGWLFYKFTSPAYRSVPDRLCISPAGQLIFIEFKRKGGKATPQQEREHQRLRDHKQIVYVVDSFESAKRIIDFME